MSEAIDAAAMATLPTPELASHVRAMLSREHRPSGAEDWSAEGHQVFVAFDEIDFASLWDPREPTREWTDDAASSRGESRVLATWDYDELDDPDAAVAELARVLTAF